MDYSELTAAVAYEGVRELASGIDALYLSGRCVIPEDLAAELDRRRTDAREGSAPVALRFGGSTLKVARGGIPSMYPYRLEHELGAIGVAPASKAPSIRLQPRSSHLHALGVRETVDALRGVVESELGNVDWSVNRLDLFADTQGWALQAEDRDRFVRRSKALRGNHQGDVFTGFEFGRRKSGTVTARLYDKTEELKGNGHFWWHDIWGDAFDIRERVLRVEFELHRAVLGQMGVRSVDEALAGVGGVWGYCTEKWLTFRDRSRDSARERWPVAGEWLAIQQASLRSTSVALDRIHSTERAFALERLMPYVFGYVASVAGLTGHSTIDTALDGLKPLLRRHESLKGKDFAALAAARAPGWGTA